MLNIKIFSLKKQNKLVKSNIFFILLLLTSNLNSFNCPLAIRELPEENVLDEEVFPPSLRDNRLFNNILMFNNKKYQVGNFATNINGDLIIQFSEEY